MWTCAKCGRTFERAGQSHSCKRVPLEKHFENKARAKGLFDCLRELINTEIGKCQVVCLPCCVHLVGAYDFLAVLPKKDGVEIRFALDRKPETSRLKVSVPVSQTMFKNCFDISSKEDFDDEMVGWLGEAYHLKDRV